MSRIKWTKNIIIEWVNNKENVGEYNFIEILEYKGRHSKILFICPKCNRPYKTSLHNFIKGKRCGCDIGKRNHTYQDMIDETKRKGYTISENDDGIYSYNKKFELICDKGHLFKMSLNDLLRNHGCPHCSKNAKLTYEYIVDFFKKYNYIILDNKYINANSILNTLCPNGHLWKVRYSDFYNGKRCSQCLMSSGEQEITRILKKYSIEYI